MPIFIEEKNWTRERLKNLSKIAEYKNHISSPEIRGPESLLIDNLLCFISFISVLCTTITLSLNPEMWMLPSTPLYPQNSLFLLVSPTSPVMVCSWLHPFLSISIVSPLTYHQIMPRWWQHPPRRNLSPHLASVRPSFTPNSSNSSKTQTWSFRNTLQSSPLPWESGIYLL